MWQIVVNEASIYRVLLPDLGYYTPQRIANDMLGLPCIEPLEDIALRSEFKSEIMAILQDAVSKAHGLDLNVSFSDAIQLEPFARANISLIPAQRLVFRESRERPPRTGDDHNYTVEANDLIITVPKGESALLFLLCTSNHDA